jgi:hypothetical protein
MSDQEKKESNKEDGWFLGVVKWVGGIVATVVGGVLIWHFTTPAGSGPQPTPSPVATVQPQRKCDNMPNKGAACSVGAGACSQTGSWVCNERGDGLICNAVPNRADNGFHNVAASNGSWDWNCDGQTERQWGTCESLTRAQCDPNTNATHGPPGFCSELRKPQGCTPTVAACGTNGWIYPCFYNQADGRCHAGGYETAAVMACR